MTRVQSLRPSKSRPTSHSGDSGPAHMTNAPTESALAAFAARVARDLGPDAINTSAEGRERYGEHTLPFDDCPPSAIVFPDSTDAVVKLVRAANEFRIPLYPISNGQSAGLGSKSPVRRGQVVVDLGRRMNRIVEVNEALGYCVVEPGVSFQAMHAELVRRGSKLMISPTAGPRRAVCSATLWTRVAVAARTRTISACAAAWRSCLALAT